MDSSDPKYLEALKKVLEQLRAGEATQFAPAQSQLPIPQVEEDERVQAPGKVNGAY